jgi:hypothetical protein
MFQCISMHCFFFFFFFFFLQLKTHQTNQSNQKPKERKKIKNKNKNKRQYLHSIQRRESGKVSFQGLAIHRVGVKLPFQILQAK